MIQERLKLDKSVIPGFVASIMNTLISNNYQAYVAGGAVRDLVIGRSCNDWDIATDALPQDVMRLFESYVSCSAIDTGSKYGTITVKWDDCEGVEVTTFRLDSEESDGRRPESVSFSKNIVDDVKRRDFTINGLVMDINGEIIDHVGGLYDIKYKLLRCIGDPYKRFKQDKLRLLRMCRQAAILDFRIDELTFIAAKSTSGLVMDCSGQAMRLEIEKILLSDNVSRGMLLLYKSNLLNEILPEVNCMFGYDQKNPHHMRNLWDHTMLCVESVPATVPLKMAALLHDTGKMTSRTFDDDGVAHYNKHHLDSEEIALKVCQRLQYSNAITEKICILVREHMNRHFTMPDSGIRRFIKRVGRENLQDLFHLQMGDLVACRPPFNVKEWVLFQEKTMIIANTPIAMTAKDLNINGHELMKMGFQNKQIGEVQKYLLDQVLDCPEKNEKDILSELASIYFSANFEN